MLFVGHGLALHDGSTRSLDNTATLRDRLFADLKATNPKSVTVE